MWSAILSILSIFGKVFDTFKYLVNPKERRRRRKNKARVELLMLQTNYRKALAGGQPLRARRIGREMEELRSKYRLIYNDS